MGEIMKKLFLIMAMVLMASTALAARLVCDPPDPAEQVTSYEVFQDGISLGITPAPLNFDLQGITPGAYTFTATAINAWGASQPSNPYISPKSTTKPSNISMIP